MSKTILKSGFVLELVFLVAKLHLTSKNIDMQNIVNL